jgi:ABC-type multidrug transport system ATPase subunit
MDESAIKVRNLRFSYGDAVAVDDISFEVDRGKIFGFLGPNGAGKSTTIKLLIGMLPLQQGEIELLGMSIGPQNHKIRSRIGVCFEEKNLYLQMTAGENLEFFARLFGVRRFSPTALLRRVGLDERSNERVKNYSKGMRQRLMVARALVNEPDLLFLDEPTDGLDPVSSQAVRTIIEEEAERGAAVLLTTHDMFEADQLSDRVAFINEGKIVATDSPEELKLKYGRRSVRIKTRRDGTIDEEVVGLDSNEAGDRLKAAAANPALMTIHTEEATLEDIFIQLTGRGLA